MRRVVRWPLGARPGRAATRAGAVPVRWVVASRVWPMEVEVDEPLGLTLGPGPCRPGV